MMIFNTFEILSRPLARKITQIGLNSTEIDILPVTILRYDRINESVQSPDLPKEIKREKLTQSN